ncbi:DNA repair protein RecO [Luteimonas sp. e5]
MQLSCEAAFVLHARAWRETSLLVEVLCAEHGRLGLVARGVSSARRHALRAALQPLQCIRLQASQRGELATLHAAEAVDAAPRLTGEAALAGFYLNELTLRLTPRQDPLPELHAAYARTRAALADACGEALAWALRRYERDLLQAIGLGFDWNVDGDGREIDPSARYRLEGEYGPRRLLRDGSPEARREAATGTALLALAADHPPPDADLASLRRPMRALLADYLAGRPLKSWEMARQLQRLGRSDPDMPG